MVAIRAGLTRESMIGEPSVLTSFNDEFAAAGR